MFQTKFSCFKNRKLFSSFPVLALYSETHPEYLKYIYLVAPISFCILNPIGFVLLEIQKRRTSEHHDGGCKVLWHVVKGVITNPIVFMTVIGIIGNFAFSQKVPVVLDGILTLLGKGRRACVCLKTVLQTGSEKNHSTAVHHSQKWKTPYV